jgi:2-keto-4-pentenoate hydratase/2-oxohepta-3-ene-1,7-dioic acid hydratase in catechol pathway
MRLLHYWTSAGPRLAIGTADGLRDGAGVQLVDVFNGHESLPSGDWLDETTLRLAPCVPDPGKIICVGLNYRSHAIESTYTIPTKPVLFAKLSNTLAASGEAIPLPSVSSQYDYEAELVAVIGRRATRVAEADALEYVWGYCNGNDLSARDLQTQSSQWLLGKSLDHFGPIGPWLVSRDEAGDLATMRVSCSVNGEVRQQATVADMIFPVQELVSFISRHITLEPGDIIFTGTPEGVADGRPDKPWLKVGDEIVVEVGTLGRLVNQLVAG